MPFEYVHRAESRRLEREEEADKIRALCAGLSLKRASKQDEVPPHLNIRISIIDDI